MFITSILLILGRVLLKLSNFVLLSTTSNVCIKSIWRLIGGLEQLERKIHDLNDALLVSSSLMGIHWP
jgi:hypothetical protein